MATQNNSTQPITIRITNKQHQTFTSTPYKGRIHAITRVLLQLYLDGRLAAEGIDAAIKAEIEKTEEARKRGF